MTYAVIRPDGASSIFGRREYLFSDLAKVVQIAAKQALDREDKAA